jgi:hypothetical protein
MTAADFREAVGGLVHRNDENGERKLQVENPHVFHEIAANLKVLARATAADKHLPEMASTTLKPWALLTWESQWAPACQPQKKLLQSFSLKTTLKLLSEP